MPRISKQVSFFRRNYFYLMGGFWLVLGVGLLLAEANIFLGYCYAIMGVIYVVFAYFKKDLPLEFIAWDEEKVEISEWQQSTRSYKWSTIDGINVSETNLTIKSGPANGTMVELKGYTEADIEKLKTELVQVQTLAAV